MPNSKANEIEYTCYACDETTTVQSWFIIDAVEKPDLIQKIKDDTFHDVVCPHCGEMISPDVPLLLYFPKDEPRFLFVSRMSDGRGYPEIVIQGMFTELVESSGDKVLQDHYSHHQAWVLKEDLPDRLKDFPQVSLRDFDWTVYPELKQFEMLMWDEYLQMVMTDYFGTPDWNQKALITEKAPLLLTPAIEPWLVAQEKAFQEMGNKENVEIIQNHRDILTRAREVGYYQAVLEFQDKDSD